MSQTIGQVPLDWTAPNGYPDVATAWRSSSALIWLWEYHRGFAQSWWDGFDKLDLTTLYPAPAPATSGEAITALSVKLTGAPLPAAHQAALQTFLNEPAGTALAKSQLRWYLGHLVPLILDSPQFALR